MDRSEQCKERRSASQESRGGADCTRLTQLDLIQGEWLHSEWSSVVSLKFTHMLLLLPPAA